MKKKSLLTKTATMSLITLFLLLQSAGVFAEPEPRLEMSDTVYVPGETIVVNYSNLPDGEKNWISIYEAGADNYDYGEWYYTFGASSGTMYFQGLDAGSYEARLFYNDSYNLEYTVAFTVEPLEPAEAVTQKYVSFLSQRNGKYVGVQTTSGGQNIKANRNIADDWVEEMFIISGSDGLRDGTTVNIRTTARHYFSARPDGDLDADRIEAGKWERFKLINLSNPGGCLQDGDSIGLLGYHGKNVKVRYDDEVCACSSAISQPNDMFTVEILPGPEPLEPGFHQNLVYHYKDGWNTERYVDVYVPYNLTGPAPLLLDLHGMGGTKEGTQWHGFKALAEEKGFVWVAPQGWSNAWNGVICCPPASDVLGVGLDDSGFLRSLVLWVAARADVDTDRIYAQGHSNGGGMVHQLGLKQADVFAALVPTAHSFSRWVIWDTPARPVPIMMVLGNRDEVLPIFMPITGTIEPGFHRWAEINGCQGGYETEYYFSPNPILLPSWRKTYCNCDGGVTTEMLKIGINHATYGQNDQGIDVTRTIWDFLSQWSLP